MAGAGGHVAEAERRAGAAVGGPDGCGAIVTPEAIALELPLASVGSRAVAALLDLAVQGLAGLGVALAGGTLGQAVGISGWAGSVVLVLTVALIRFGYPILFEARWRGRTPGMAAMGLRVVTREGGPITARHATVRAAVGVVDFELTLGAAALLTALISRAGQRLGDLAAGTVVLHERRGHGRAEPARFDPPAGCEQVVTELDVSAVDPASYARLRTLLLRRHTLSPTALEGLARQLAGELVERIRPAPPAGMDPLTWLGCVAAAYQRRHRTWQPRAQTVATVGSGWHDARRADPLVGPRTVPGPDAAAPLDTPTGFRPPA